MVHLQLKAFCHWFGVPVSKSVILNHILGSVGEIDILLFSNGVDFHPALLFQEGLSQYLWNGRSTFKIEENRLELIVFQ